MQASKTCVTHPRNYNGVLDDYQIFESVQIIAAEK
jgi:hypothetical protein